MNSKFLKKLPGWIYFVIGTFSFGMFAWVFYSHFNDAEAHPWLELGVGWMLAGALCLWSGTDYSRSPLIRFFCMLFFAMIALVHWLEFARGRMPMYFPLTQSIPIVSLVLAELVICNLVKD